MAEGEATSSSSFSESDGNSILSGSVCYSTDLSEDSKMMSDVSGEVDQVLDEVLPYFFEPVRRSDTYSEPEDEAAVVADIPLVKSKLEILTGR